MISQKLLIQIFILAGLTLIASFLPWAGSFSWSGFNGWNGQVNLWDVTFQNWFVTLTLLLYYLALALKSMKVLESPLKWLLPLLFVFPLHFLIIAYLYIVSSVSIGPGYFLMLVAYCPTVVISLKLLKAEKAMRASTGTGNDKKDFTNPA